MFLPRDLPSNTSNTIEFELWEGLLHITAIRLTRREAASTAVLGAFGVISCAIVSSLLFYLLSHVFYVVGVYLLNLLIFDLGMSLAAMCDIRWSQEFIIRHENLCVFQGISNQFGVTGAIFWNLCLAVQTFCLLYIRYTPPQWEKWVVVPCGWLFALLITIVGPIRNKSPYSFYGPNSDGCWLTIGSSNAKSWLLAVAFLSVSALTIMLILYVILFLSLSGALDRISNRQISSVGKGSSSGVAGGRSEVPSSVTRGRQVRKVARKMLWYPISYLVGSLPLVVCVILGSQDKILDHSVYVFSNTFFVCISDVLIFASTRRHLLAATPTTPSTREGISMTVVTSVFNPPNQPGMVVDPRAHPDVRPQSSVDSLESEVAS
ncbi:hypothetical protein BDY24DRAFT_416074 [Mrakia frigida]|uniref:uncharacterized protein n=1 Tax=Mrakia frigida TaxID=29902 RepID=UPI003FCC12B9